MKIFSFVNALVDAVINYKISRFDTIYPYFIKYIKYVLFRTKNGMNIQTLPSPLSNYINFYLEMNFCLKKQDYEKEMLKIQRFLKDYENQLKNHGIIDGNKIPLITDALELFSDYLESEKSSIFINCITKILKSLNNWSNGLINNTIKKIFHLK